MEGQGRILLAVATCFCLFNGALACNPEWTENDGKCYLIVEFRFDIRMARRYCQQYGGGDLAYVGSNETFQFLQSLENYGQSVFWIKENSILDNSTSEESNECPFLTRERMDYSNCDDQKAFICEQIEADTTIACPRTWHLYGTSCYKPMNETDTFVKAVDACAVQRGSIAILDDISKEHHAAAVILGRNITFIVGAKRVEGSNNFEWVNRKPFAPSCPQCVLNSTGDCLGFQSPFDHPLQLRWVHLDCSATNYYLCEIQPYLKTTTPRALTTTLPTTTSTEVPLQCPHGYNWKSHESSGFCFWETTYETERLNWHQARVFCQAFGGDLATYADSSQEIAGLGGAKGHYRGLWFGLSRSEDNVFSWVDGSPLNYTNWEYEQPNLDNPYQFCAVHGAFNSMWELDYCGVRRWFICKAPKTRNVVMPDTSNLFKKTMCNITTPGRSNRVWYYFEDHCYLAHLEPHYTWHMADTFCRDNGAHLLSVHSFEETDFVISLYSTLSLRSFWIGLSISRLDDEISSWTDGSPLNFLYLKDGNRSVNQMNTCVSFDSTKGFSSYEHCNTFKAVLCKRPVNTSSEFNVPEPTPVLPGNCQPDWYQLGNKCYRVFGAMRSQRLDFEDAQQDCRNQSGDLASIHNQEEQDFLTDLTSIVAAEAYIGLHKLSSSILEWTDRSPIDFTTWSGDAWSATSERACVVLTNNEVESNWRFDACSKVQPYICQKNKDPSITVPPPDPFACRNVSGWLSLGNTCFGLFEDQELDWVSAQRKCRDFNGSLASIKSHSFGIFIKKKLKVKNKFLWIGAREVKPNQYGLLSGEKLTYTNWLPLQPRNVAPSLENCVTLNDNSQWVVKSCKEPHGFICDLVESENHLDSEFLKAGNSCPLLGWEDLGGDSCYIFEYEPLSFAQAWNYCFKRNGNLASFHSKEEVSRVENHFKSRNGTFIPDFMIGLAERHNEELAWVDNSPVDFTNFGGTPPPENIYSERPCVVMQMRTGQWRRVDCGPRPFMCSTPKIAGPAQDAWSSYSSIEEHEDIPSKMTAGAILGIVICLLVIVAVIAVTAYYMCLRKGTRIPLEETDSL